jgi:hypothetical protein
MRPRCYPPLILNPDVTFLLSAGDMEVRRLEAFTFSGDLRNVDELAGCPQVKRASATRSGGCRSGSAGPAGVPGSGLPGYRFQRGSFPAMARQSSARCCSVPPAVQVAHQGNLGAVMDQLPVDVQDPVLHGKPLGTHRGRNLQVSV